MKRTTALSSKQRLALGFCLVVIIGIIMLAFLSTYIDSKRQDSLIYDMKGLSYLEYFYFGNSTEISEITQIEGFEYGLSGGMGTHLGQTDLPLWQGTKAIEPSLKLEPCYLIRIANNQVEARNSQYADLTINHVKNDNAPDVYDYVNTVGFSYDQNTYVITSNGQIYEVADESFFIDLFSFLEDHGVLPQKVN